MRSSVKASWSIFYLLQVILVATVMFLFYTLTHEVKQCTISTKNIEQILRSGEVIEYETN